VSDVRTRATVNGKAAAPGELLEFLAQIRGWQSEARKQRRDQLLQLIHFARETPELDDEGWRYQVRSVIWCRSESVENVEFARSKRSSSKMNGTKRSLTFNIVARCVTGEDKERSSASMKRIKSTPNPQARRPRVAHGHGIAARDVTSKSDEDEEEGVEWGKRMYGVRMSPAHPRYIGRGDETCGGEVVYTIQEIRKLLRSQPEDVKRWLTTSQMGWALTR